MRRGFAVFVLAGMLAAGATMPALTAEKEEDVVRGTKGMVVAVSPPAVDVGLAVLKDGGNAVDAAVAVGLAMAVTYPQAGNIGGGGFMLVHPDKGDPAVFDYRETAPKAAHAKTFTKDDTWYSHRAVGVPGTVRGMALAHQKLGSKPWKDLVMPAVLLAEKGFKVDAQLASSLNWFIDSSTASKEAVRVFSPPGKSTWSAGDLLVQKDLGATLRRIAEDGPDAFYKGPIADMIAAEMKAGNGLITREDLEAYTAKARKPIHTTYRGHDVYAPPPASSGGITLSLMLNMLEPMDLRTKGRWSPETLHAMIETMRRAYHERAKYLGDTDFVNVPIAKLTSKEYARELAKTIDPLHATKSEDLAKDIPLSAESENTTHFSVIDAHGMAVSNTYTLERSYGSGIVVRGAGLLLNNEMGDFNWFPGVTTRTGTIGTEPNQVGPGKRMLSSMTPTIVARDGKVRIVTGSPGSRTIINTSLQVVLNVVEFDMTPREAVDAPRLHHQWFPDEARFEGISTYADAVKKLEEMGHKISWTRQGDAHTICVDPKTGAYIGVPDRRINGKAAGW
jgi:gamma-glutamyltranspeptidase/glutathione hydrolase